jgi:L,D-transpeptidase ErfK/SrfK
LPKCHLLFGPGFFASGARFIFDIEERYRFLSMRRTVHRTFAHNCFCLLAVWIFIASLQGCAALRGAQEKPRLAPSHTDKDIERHNFPLTGGDDVIGRLAMVRVEEGDTLADIARHFGVGLNAISAANPGVDPWVPRAGERIILPLSFILPDAPRKGIVINLATMRLFHYKGNGAAQLVSTYPVGVGAEDRPTPPGPTRVVRKTARPTWHVPASIAERHRKKGDILPASIPPGPDNPLGEYALYLGKAGYLIHGTNKPASVGLQATNGCMRLYPENIKTLFGETPVNTPVLIVNQPYLVGRRDGALYVEAHGSPESSNSGELLKMHDKLRRMEKKSARQLDWNRIKAVEARSLGIPVPVSGPGQGSEKELLESVEVEHPGTLYGKPDVPEMTKDAWYIQAAYMRDETDARRLAAIITHQGPPIPARIVPKSGGGYRVIAGPFKDGGEARDAAKRIKYDLEIDAFVFDASRK